MTHIYSLDIMSTLFNYIEDETWYEIETSLENLWRSNCLIPILIGSHSQTEASVRSWLNQLRGE